MLPSWVSYCRVDDLGVFLDIRRDRYTAVPWKSAELIIHAGEATMPAQLEEKVRALGWIDDTPTQIVRTPPQRVALQELGPDFTNSPAPARLIAQCLGRLTKARLTLALHPLERVLAGVSARNLPCGPDVAADPATIAQTLCAFRKAERYALTSKTCLLRSLALQSALAQLGLAADLVFGVKLHPFEAHCWLQQDTILLNDTVERTGLFVPIRVVQ